MPGSLIDACACGGDGDTSGPCRSVLCRCVVLMADGGPPCDCAVHGLRAAGDAAGGLASAWFDARDSYPAGRNWPPGVESISILIDDGGVCRLRVGCSTIGALEALPSTWRCLPVVGLPVGARRDRGPLHEDC